jgi:hypothetical protein
LKNKGLTHTEVTITLLAGEFVFAVVTLLLQDININIVIASQFVLYFSAVYMLKRFIPVRKKLHIVREETMGEEEQDSKVYLIYPVKEKVSANEE